MQITQGQRLTLASAGLADRLDLTINIRSPHVIDFVCFGLDAEHKLSDDRYMVFFNQPAAPGDAVRLRDGGRFEIDLSALPASIERLVFTASIDGTGVMKDLAASSFTLGGPATAPAVICEFSGSTFSVEKAIMVADIYRKAGEWRVQANLQGFAEGLDALVRHFGGEISDDAPAPAAAVTAPTVSLEKKVSAAAPALVSLAKKAQISLEKKNLTELKARVAIVLDASGSMNGQYSRGRVQEVLNRLLPLAVAFDSDGELDVFAFGAKPMQLSAATLSNYRDYVNTDHGGWRQWELGSRINDEPKAMRMVMDFYRRLEDKTPVYILFLSDGGVSESRAITKLMIESAGQPFFWQFVGLGGSNYGVLERLDDLEGRLVDNCNFFAVDELHDLSEEELYDRLMEEFPAWLRDAKQKGIIA